MTVHPQAKTPTAGGYVAGAARGVTEAISKVRTEAPGWMGGALAGVQGALFSLALVLIPMWVIAASADGAQVSWGQATGIATRVWLTGFAVPWAVDGVPVTLVPLGIAALTALMLVQLSRRFASPTWTAGLAATASFAATVGVATSIAWAGADDVENRVTRAVLISCALAAPAVAWGLVRQRGAVLAWLGRVPSTVRVGVRMAVAMAAGTLLLSALTLVVSTISARHTVADAATSLGVDVAGGIALALLETLYAPTLVVWTVSWLSGAGYVLGGVISSSAEAPTATIPALPLLATLPHGAGGPLALSPLVIVALGAAVVVALRKRLTSGMGDVAAVGVALALFAFGFGAASRVSRGAIGPGTLAVVGPEPLIAAVMPALELGIGAVLAIALMGAVRAMRSGELTAGRFRTGPSPHRETPADTPGHPAE